MERKMRLSLGWYSQNQEEWKEYLSLWKNEEVVKHNYRGAILPHAGWFYSGHHGYRFFLGLDYKPDVIILMGGHRGSLDPSYYLDYTAYKSPFGTVKAELYLKQFFDKANWATGAGDNSIEVFLPFLSRFFPEAPLLAFSPAPGNNTREVLSEIKNLIDRNFHHPLVLASADLTHYGPNYGFVEPSWHGKENIHIKEREENLFNIIKRRDIDGITPYIESTLTSCSPGSIESIAYWFKSSSGDTKLLLHDSSLIRGPSNSFVGYATVGFS